MTTAPEELALLPVPEPDAASAHFFAALDEGRIALLRCLDCGTHHLGVLACDECGGSRFETEQASGEGTVHSFTRLHMAHHPAFADELPLVAGVVELAEGPRLFARLLGGADAADQWAVGAAVIAEVRRVGPRGVLEFRARR